MTVSNPNNNSHSYIPGAAMLPEPIPFQFIDATDVRVRNPAGVVQVLGVDYVIDGDGRTGAATITTLHGYGAAVILSLRRTTGFVQEAKTEPFKPLPGESVERELDRRAMIEAEISRDMIAYAERALKVPEGETAPDFASLAGLIDGDLIEFRDGKFSRFAHAPFAGKYWVGDAEGHPQPTAAVTGGDAALRGDLVSLAGGELVSMSQLGAGAVVQTLRSWARRVGVYPEQYRAVGDGITDDTDALQRMFSDNTVKNKTYHLLGTYKVTATLIIPRGADIQGHGQGGIVTVAGNTSGFTSGPGDWFTMHGLRAEATVSGSDAYIAAIVADRSTACKVSKCTFVGYQWGGFYGASVTHCTVSGTFVRDLLGTVPNAADINFYYDSQYNSAHGNFLFGGRAFGVNVQDPLGVGTYFPAYNSIKDNVIGPHTFYGVNLYIGGAIVARFTASIAGTVMNVTAMTMGTIADGNEVTAYGVLPDSICVIPGGTGTGGIGTYNLSKAPPTAIASQALTSTTLRNSFNIVSGNYIYGVTGSESPFSGGNGIYCVGAGLGGCRIVDNGVDDCCIATLLRQNAPAGIAVTGWGASALRIPGVVNPFVGGNTVNGMRQGDGISINNNRQGVTLGPNNATIPATNNGSGPGGGALEGMPLRIADADHWTISGGDYQNFGDNDAIFVFAASRTMIGGTISGPNTFAKTGYAIRTARTNISYRFERLTLNGMTGWSASGSFLLEGIRNGSVLGLSVETTANYGAEIRNCTNTPFVGNHMEGANFSLTTSGDCNGSRIDKSNILPRTVENNATGMIIERYGSSPPGAGKGAIGDVIINSEPAIGEPEKWTCTNIAGVGTWTPGHVFA